MLVPGVRTCPPMGYYGLIKVSFVILIFGNLPFARTAEAKDGKTPFPSLESRDTAYLVALP